MNILAKTLAAIAAGTLLATNALAQSAASLVVPKAGVLGSGSGGVICDVPALPMRLRLR